MTTSHSRLPTSSITPISTGNSNAYLILDGDRSILVDAGMPGMAGRILAKARNAGIRPQDIGLIVLTHSHIDHVGSLFALKKATEAQVLIHAMEADHIRKGHSPFPAGTNRFSRVISFLGQRLLSRLVNFTPTEPDQIVTKKCDLRPLGFQGELLHTPGHSCGSICLLLEEGTALAGDTVFGIFPNSAFPPFAENVQELLSSWHLLLSAGCQEFLPGHGRPVSRALLQSSYDKLRKQ